MILDCVVRFFPRDIVNVSSPLFTTPYTSSLCLFSVYFFLSLFSDNFFFTLFSLNIFLSLFLSCSCIHVTHAHEIPSGLCPVLSRAVRRPSRWKHIFGGGSDVRGGAPTPTKRTGRGVGPNVPRVSFIYCPVGLTAPVAAAAAPRIGRSRSRTGAFGRLASVCRRCRIAADRLFQT